MTNTKSFEILSINRGSDFLVVWLGEDIPFTNGGWSYINFTKTYPFSNWQIGDSISVDLDRIKYKRSSEYINDSQIAWQNTYPCPEEDYRCSRKKADSDSCCNYHHRQFKNQVRQKTSISNTIQDVAKFNAWWNNNLATVVNGDDYFTIYLLVYDDKDSRIREFRSNSNSYNLDNAKSQALTLRTNLNGDNPILYIHPKANSYVSFGEIINEYSGFIKKINVPCEMKWEEKGGDACTCYPSCNCVACDCHDNEQMKTKYVCRNPSNYLKPLDIVWVGKNIALNPYYHVGVYLDNNQVCDVPGDPVNKKGIRVRSWGEFEDGCINGEIFAYRAIVPFKHFKQIAQQIGWAEVNKWREGGYSLGNQNCEHAANMFVYGIEYSKQAEERNVPGTTNKGKISLNLTNEISQTNSQLYQDDNNWRAQQVVQQVRFHTPMKNNWWL